MENINNFKGISMKVAHKSSFVLERVQRAYIDSTYRSNLTQGFSVCSQMIGANKAAVKPLNKFISTKRSLPIDGLDFVKLESSSYESLCLQTPVLHVMATHRRGWDLLLQQ